MLTRDFLTLNADLQTAFHAIITASGRQNQRPPWRPACRPDAADGLVDLLVTSANVEPGAGIHYRESCTGIRALPLAPRVLFIGGPPYGSMQPGPYAGAERRWAHDRRRHRPPDESLEEELTPREAGDDYRRYLPTSRKLELDDGRTVNAPVFITDPRHPLFEADTSAGDCGAADMRAKGAAWHQRSASVRVDQSCANSACTTLASTI